MLVGPISGHCETSRRFVAVTAWMADSQQIERVTDGPAVPQWMVSSTAPVVIADMEINMEVAKHESEFIKIDKSAWIFLVDHLNKWHKSRYLTGDVTTIKADHAWHLLLFTWWRLHLWGIKQDIKWVIASSHRAGNSIKEVVLRWSLCVKYGHCCGVEKAA